MSERNFEQLIKEPLTLQEEKQAHQLRRSCRLLAPTDIDIAFYTKE